MTVNSITLLIDKYPASTTLRNFRAIQTYYQADGTTVANTYTTTHPFYYDQIVGPPIIDSVSAVLTSPTIYVSGVSIVANNPTFDVTTVTRNMGDYFYHNPLLTYTFEGSASGVVNETNTNNVISGISGGQFVDPVTFRNTNVSGTINPGYGKDIVIEVKAFNIVQSNDNQKFANVDKQGIYDYPSYALLYSSNGIIGTPQDKIIIKKLEAKMAVIREII
jgi:hypothetical protein